MKATKSFDISMKSVEDAYRKVKKKKGGPGVDGVTLKEFQLRREKNLYKIWNRMSSGSYFPSPVLRVEIPKDDGSSRKLGVPTVTDRVAQMVAAAEGAKVRLEKLQEDIANEDYDSVDHYGVDSETILEILEEEFERYKKRITDLSDEG